MNELKRENLGWFKIHNLFVDYAMKEIGCVSACIYFSLVRYTNQESGISFPSQERIARELGISVRTVLRHISKLEDYGLIKRNKERKSGHWEHYTYRITDPKVGWRFTVSDEISEPYDNMSSGRKESTLSPSNHTTKTTTLYDKDDVDRTTESHIKKTNYIKTKDINTNNTPKAELSDDERKKKFEEIRKSLGIRKVPSKKPL